MPLYDILNEFQEGLSHIALVLRHRIEVAEHSTNCKHAPVGSLTSSLFSIQNIHDIRIMLVLFVTSFLLMIELITYMKLVSAREVRMNIYGESHHQNLGLRRSRRSLRNLQAIPRSASISRRETSKSKRWSETIDSNILHIGEAPLPSFTKEEEVIGIITMEDVIEQLLKVWEYLCSYLKRY